MTNEQRPQDDRDEMLSRIVDAEASSADWLRFRELAAGDPAVWAELSVMQRQQDELVRAVERATTPAARVELDEAELDRAMPDERLRLQGRLDVVSRWGGWAAAAALVLVWATGFRPAAPGGNGGGAMDGMRGSGSFVEAGLGPRLQEATPSDAFERYLSAGKATGSVLGEMPDRVVLSTTPLESGVVEVVFLRQIIERRVVDEVYRPSRDEHGDRVVLPARVAPGAGRAF